jgi:uncharacterized protein YjbJ (UPF0337 family)
MDKERVKGKGNEIKGGLRQAYGRAVGDEQQVAQGEAEEARGKAQGMVGAVKETARAVGEAAKGVVGAVKDATRSKKRDGEYPAR